MASNKVPMNDLDRAVWAMRRGQSALPDLLRELAKGELWFLIRHQNEIDGMVVKLEDGMPVPFVQIGDSRGDLVPIFSSFERMGEALKNAKVPENKYAGGAMPGQDLLMMLGHLKLRTVLNKSCSTGEIELSQNLLDGVGDGSAFQRSGVEEDDDWKNDVMRVIDPADYPTELLQPSFEILRKHVEFRAAWVLATESKKGAEIAYRIYLHMDPRNEQVLHDFDLVLATMRKRYDVFSLTLDETDPSHPEAFWEMAEPFYVAVDHPKRRSGK